MITKYFKKWFIFSYGCFFQRCFKLINVCQLISDSDGDKITIDLLEFSLQQQEGNGIEEEEADVFSMVIMTLMSAISKRLWKQK